MTYTTIDAVAMFLNIDADTLTDMEQSQLDQLIPYVGGVIDSYCGYKLGAVDYTDRRYNGEGTSTLDLGIYPVNSLTQLRVRASDGTFSDYTARVEVLEDGTLQFLPSSGGTFPAGTGNVYASFNAGWAVIPQDVAYAATYLVSLNFNKVSGLLLGIAEQSATNGINTKYDSIELPVLVKRVLDRYRKLSIL